MSGTASSAIERSSAVVRANRGPSPSTNESPSPIASGNGQDVGEENRRVERKARERLQRHFGGERRRRRQRHEAAGARAQSPLYSGR